MLTIGADVFVSARVLTEIHHSDSDGFLNRAVQKAIDIFCPTLVVPEVTSALARSSGDTRLARAAVSQIGSFPYLSLIELTEGRALLAAAVAVTQRLRGADAVYVAVAQEYGTTLITWDVELLTRGALSVPTMTPSDWLAANPNI